MSFQHRPIDSPELTAKLREIKRRREFEPGPSDSDRIAWMDGLPKGTLLTVDGKDDNPNIEAERIAEGWRVSFYYTGHHCFTRPVATWREVVDLMEKPPEPKEEVERFGSLLDWEESAARGCKP